MDSIEVSKLNELQSHINDQAAILVYFYNDNCAPCLSLRPKVIELIEKEFPKLKLVFVNSINRELPINYGVYDNPTLLVFFDRKEYIRESKYVAMPQLQKGIERYYKLMFD
jgi:thioredoxin 1